MPGALFRLNPRNWLFRAHLEEILNLVQMLTDFTVMTMSLECGVV